MTVTAVMPVFTPPGAEPRPLTDSVIVVTPESDELPEPEPLLDPDELPESEDPLDAVVVGVGVGVTGALSVTS